MKAGPRAASGSLLSFRCAILAIGAVLALGALWALLPAAVVGVVVLVIRTNLEDATLQRELPGYAEFAAYVRGKLDSGRLVAVG